jgi:hypothetical protein
LCLAIPILGLTNVPVNFPLSKNFPVYHQSVRPLNALIILKCTSESISL